MAQDIHIVYEIYKSFLFSTCTSYRHSAVEWKFLDSSNHVCLIPCYISKSSKLFHCGSRRHSIWWHQTCTNHLDCLALARLYPQVSEDLLYAILRISHRAMMWKLSHGQRVFVAPCPFSFPSSKPSAWILSIALPSYSLSLPSHNFLCKSNYEYLAFHTSWICPKALVVMHKATWKFAIPPVTGIPHFTALQAYLVF